MLRMKTLGASKSLVFVKYTKQTRKLRATPHIPKTDAKAAKTLKTVLIVSLSPRERKRVYVGVITLGNGAWANYEKVFCDLD